MDQLELFPLPDVPSPCIQVCQRNSKGYCTGCWRNRHERFNWNDFSFEEKCHVLALCQRRKRIVELHQSDTSNTEEVAELPTQLELASLNESEQNSCE